MAKNTGMNAKDEKAGKTAKLPPSKVKEANKKLDDEKNAQAPIRTVEMVTNAREKKKNK